MTDICFVSGCDRKILSQRRKVHFLPDRHDDQIDIQRFKFAFDRNRGASAGSVRLSEFHNLQLDLPDMPVLADDFRGIRQKFVGDAFLDRLFDLNFT